MGRGPRRAARHRLRRDRGDRVVHRRERDDRDRGLDLAAAGGSRRTRSPSTGWRSCASYWPEPAVRLRPSSVANSLIWLVSSDELDLLARARPCSPRKAARRPAGPRRALGRSSNPASAASSSRSAAWICLGLDVEVHVHLRAHRLHHIDLGPELDPVRVLLLLDRRVLEVLRAHPHDHLAAAAVRPARRSGSAMSPNGSLTGPPSSRPGRKFIDGEPIKPATNRFCGSLIQIRRRVDLLDDPAAHDRHAVAERHRLGLIVGDIDHRGAQLLLDPRHLGPHLHAQLGVQVRQRLVHQKRLRIAHDRAPHRHPLTLTARQVGRLALQMLLEIQDPRRLRRPCDRSPPYPPWPASARSPCCRAPSYADTAHNSETPSRYRDHAAPDHSRARRR